MDTKKGFERVAALLQQAQDAEGLSPSEREQLNLLLRGSEENRAFAAQYLLDGEALAAALAAEDMTMIAVGGAAKGFPARALARVRVLYPALAWAASILIVAGLFLAWMNRPPIASIRDEADAVFAEGRSPRNGALKRELYRLDSGMIAVVFRNGNTMTVKAPAEFQVVDETRVRLLRGTIRASTSEEGERFVIETPDADIEDLGTEFGVSVDDEAGQSQVHVFDGRVDVKKRSEQVVLASLLLGDSAVFVKGELGSGITADPGSYLTPADVSFHRWSNLSNRIRKDEDLVFYYDFHDQPGDGEVLRDVAHHADPIDGKISGARWVNGRWPGKRALLFDEREDEVAIDIPGSFSQISFAAWVYIDRYDSEHTAIMNSLGWEEGSVHMQIRRSGRIFTGNAYPRPKHTMTGEQVPLGRWVHLVALVDAKAKQSSVWIDGKLARESSYDQEPKIEPGLCLLGGYGLEADGARTRGLHGRIDEVAFWKRTLTKKEIWRLYSKGRPSPPQS